MKNIHFHELEKKIYLKSRNNLRNFLIDVFKKEKKRINKIDFILCSDNFLLSLNKTFLNHDYFTDTLSFLLSEQHENILGEVYISIERIKYNAKKLKLPYQQELIRVIIHSSLHLCGYLDSSSKTKKIMIEKQEKYLNHWLFHVKP